jgi:hypothetical protein
LREGLDSIPARLPDGQITCCLEFANPVAAQAFLALSEEPFSARRCVTSGHDLRKRVVRLEKATPYGVPRHFQFLENGVIFRRAPQSQDPPQRKSSATMFITFESRPSNSPYLERVWRCYSTSGGPFHSMAEGNLELVVTRVGGFVQVTLRGPVTQAATADCPANGEWVAIRFRVGTYFPGLPTARLLDHRDLHLPTTKDGRFWLEGEAWEIPGYENAEVFVTRLAKRGLTAIEPAVDAAIEGDPQFVSRRSVQRRFLRATGLTHAQFRTIERARYAVDLLRGGKGILDAVHDAGYFDQAHLTRSLKHLIGQTPMKILRNEAQLSFLYKT